MASEEERKRISKKPLWDQFTDAFRPGNQGEANQALGNVPAKPKTESPEAEALRRRRIKSQ